MNPRLHETITLEGCGHWTHQERPEGCGHWTHQERPKEVNEALLEFLASL